MASTISGKTLTVTINESITLGSDDYGNKTQFDVPNIAEVSQRIMTVPTHKVPVMILSSSAGAGTFASGSLKYARISNLDNKNFIQLTFMSQSAGVTKNKCEFKRGLLYPLTVTQQVFLLRLVQKLVLLFFALNQFCLLITF